MTGPTFARTCPEPTTERAADNLADAVRVLLAYGGSTWTVKECLEQYEKAKERER